MGFNVEKFNENSKFDVLKNLGNLKFLALEKQPVFEDGKRVEGEYRVSHAVVYSEKIGDNLQLKLTGDQSYEELPFMTDIRIIGEASPFIYNFDSVIGFGDNRQEITDYGFSLRVAGYERVKTPNVPTSFAAPKEKDSEKANS
ncbi:hypothetical protein [Streptococcus merionis]|uniref:hypothetical protein n=1 Tax=Streptococcus merionis TaxID=400065 RepID=UPI003518F921